MIIRIWLEYYLAEVYYYKLNKTKISHNKYFFDIICEWKNREDILKKVKNSEIKWEFSKDDYLIMRKDLMHFKKVLKRKKD